MRIQRIDQIEAYITEQKTVTLEELCSRFCISKNTIRRDINQLLLRGNIEKVYGGVKAVPRQQGTYTSLISYGERNIKNHDIKDQIAQAAASHIASGDSIFIDTGTTTINLIDYIRDKENVTLITNSVELVRKALAYPALKLICLPGILNHQTASLVGAGCIEYLQQFNIKKAFMACTSISLTNGVSNSTHEEYEIKKAAISGSRERYLLVDHTKFDQDALCTFGHLQDFHTVITDRMPSGGYQDAFRKYGIALQIAPEKALPSA